jgi:hypothetical protein
MSCEVDTTIQLDEERTDINEVEGEMCHLSDPRRRSLGQPSVEGSGAKRRTLNGTSGQPLRGSGATRTLVLSKSITTAAIPAVGSV